MKATVLSLTLSVFFICALFLCIFCVALADDVPSRSLLLERGIARRFEQARAAAQNGRIADAVATIGELLEGELLIPYSDTAIPVGTTSRETWQQHLEATLCNWGNDAMQLYHSQYEPLAASLLREAEEKSDVAKLSQIAIRYFLTPSGRDAAMRVAVNRFTQGDTAAALCLLERLAADSEVLTLAAREAIYHNSTENTAPTSTQIAAWMARRDWRQTGGTPWQIAPTQTSPPLLSADWHVATFVNNDWSHTATRLARRLRDSTGSTATFLPAGEPLVVGSVMLMRGFDETLGVDIVSGKRLWVAREPSMQTLAMPSTPQFPALRVSREQLFSQRRSFVIAAMGWLDRVYNSLTATDNLFFQIEGLSFVPAASLLPHRGLLMGRRDGSIRGGGNTLVARRIATGELVWELGQRQLLASLQSTDQQNNKQKEAALLGEQTFLGPPLVLGDRLTVLGESGGVIRLFTLETASGRLVRVQPLTMPSVPIELDTVRSYAAAVPAWRSGIIICPTWAGEIIAVDAVSSMPLWSHCYRRETVPSDGNAGSTLRLPAFDISGSTESLAALLARRGWQRPVILIDRHRVIVAPADAAMLLCLDIVTGEQLWRIDNLAQLSQSQPLGIAALQDDTLYLLTNQSLVAVNATTGAWRGNNNNKVCQLPSRVAGYGVAGDGVYLVPLADGSIISVNLSSLTIQDHWGSEDGELFGNLVATRGRFFSTTPLGVTSFTQRGSLTHKPQDNPALATARLAWHDKKLDEAWQLLRPLVRSGVPRAVAMMTTMLHTVLNNSDSLAISESEFADALYETLAQIADPNDAASLLIAVLDAPDKSTLHSDALLQLEKLGEHEDYLVAVDTLWSVRLKILIAQRTGKLALSQHSPQHSSTPATQTQPPAWLDGVATAHLAPRDTLSDILTPASLRHIPLARLATDAESLHFSLDIAEQWQRLVATDAWGERLWECGLLEATDETAWDGTSLWWAQCGNIVLVSRGRLLTALDVSEASWSHSPRTLWTRTLSAPLEMRQHTEAVPVEHAIELLGGNNVGVPLITTLHTLCFLEHESGTLIVLDPLTGERLWQRQIETQAASLIGRNNSDTAFVLRHDLGDILAVDLKTGRLRSAAPMISGTVVSSFGESLVVVTSEDEQYSVAVVDVCTQNAITQDTFQIGSLLCFNSDGRFTTIKPQSKPSNSFDVVLLGCDTDDILVLEREPHGAGAVNVATYERRLPPRQQPVVPVRHGRIMRYSHDVTPRWAEPVTLNETFVIASLPPDFPLIVAAAFVVSPTERDKPPNVRLALTVINKSTGRCCFDEVIDIGEILGTFSVRLDAARQIIVTVPQCEIVLRF